MLAQSSNVKCCEQVRLHNLIIIFLCFPFLIERIILCSSLRRIPLSLLVWQTEAQQLVRYQLQQFYLVFID